MITTYRKNPPGINYVKPSSVKSKSVSAWNRMFVGFLVLAAAACGLAVIAGTHVVPTMHEATLHDMDHSQKHPAFHAPGGADQLRKHNEYLKAQFEQAYHVPESVKRKQKQIEEANANAHANANANAVGLATPAQNIESNPDNDGYLPDVLKAHSGYSDGDSDGDDDGDDDGDGDSDGDGDGDIMGQKYHMVFSTSCSPFQNWQSLAFFYFAHKVRQPGTVTRLVSGCSDEEAETLRKVHRERVVPLQIPGLQIFEMHVTPNFDTSGGGDQKYFNKPNGLLHWMETSLGFDGKSDHEDDDSIVIILDPDMMLLRPITSDFSTNNYNGGWVDTKNTKNHHAEGKDVVDYTNDVVRHGHPHAQKYGYGDGWLHAVRDHVEEIIGDPDSPVLTMTLQDAADYYPAGPPYLATAKDMYQIAVHWVKFLPKYHGFFDGMMCEMHSYSMAAAHLNLPHKLADGFMVSDYESSENFDFIDQKMTKANVCQNPPDLVPAFPGEKDMDPADSTTMTDPAYEKLGIPIRNLPFVLHFCQRYSLGRFFFSKYKLQEDLFDNCEGPLMIEPPRNVAEIYDWNMFPNGVEFHDFTPHKSTTRTPPEHHLRNGWFLCAVVLGVNEAMKEFKTASCGNNEEYFRKTWHFHEDKAFRDSIEDPSNPFQKDE